MPLKPKMQTGKDFAGMQFRVQVSPLDCTGCGNCEQVCPAKGKALVMKPQASQEVQNGNWNFTMSLPEVRPDSLMTIKNTQACKPLFEFSGACAGCGRDSVCETCYPTVR